jgi:hypothetical protein
MHRRKDDSVTGRLERIERQLSDIDRKLDTLTRLGIVDLKLEYSQMAILDDIQAQVDASLAKVTALADPLAAIEAALEDNKVAIATLQAQLADALANGDTAKATAISEKMGQLLAAIDTHAQAEAALANTPAEPTP